MSTLGLARVRRSAGMGAVSVSSITPAAAHTFAATETVDVTAHAHNAAGSEVSLTGRSVVWATSNASIATVASTGHGTATVTGVAEGDCDITVTVDGVASTAKAITVSAGGGAASNEPDGMTVYADRGFDDSTASGGRLDASEVYNSAIGWSANNSVSNGNYTVATDATAPVSPSNVGKITYQSTLLSGFDPMGQVGATDSYSSGSQQVTVPTGIKQLYMRQRFKLSAGWNTPAGVGAVHKDSGATNAPSVVKLGFVARRSDAAIFYIVLSGTSSPFTLDVRSQGFTYPNSPPAGWLRNLGSAGDDEVAVDTWHDLEILLQMNSAAGVQDGEVDVWLNGTHIISTGSAPYDGSTYDKPNWWPTGTAENPTGYWEGPRLSPTWGGADNYRNDTEFYAYWDHFYVSGKA